MTFEDLRSKTRTQIVNEFEPISVSQRVEWHNKGPVKDVLAKSFTEKLAEYIENQVKIFLKDNKISEKRWLKHGVIQSFPPEKEILSIILYYKTWRTEIKRKVTIGYDFIINN